VTALMAKKAKSLQTSICLPLCRQERASPLRPPHCMKQTADGGYSGRFANAPRDLPGRKAGEVALFGEADISDWMFMRNGKIVGGETIRPLLKSLPKADADALRARLETP
jgi:Uncharacterized protein conserved in bacteria (DUF2314)